MKCLYCNQEIINKEKQNEWHDKCVKRFFGSNSLPKINITKVNYEIDNLLEKMINEKKTVSGVQKKLSLHLENIDGNERLTLIGYPEEFILKPNPSDIKYCAISENLVMNMADICGIKTPLHSLIRLENDDLAYIIKRIDRCKNEKIHMEDFQQLSNRQAEYKYSSSYEKCAKIIDLYSTLKEFDKIELFYRILFSFVTLNSDMHLKNFSLIYENNERRLSKQYDLLPVNLLIDDKDETALTLNEKRRNLRKNDFIKFGINIGLNEKQIISLIKKIQKYQNTFIELIQNSRLDKEYQDRFIEMMNERYKRIEL